MITLERFDESLAQTKFDAVVVGCGLSGCVLAERMANLHDKKVLIIEKRGHIAGNCYDYTDLDTGILMNKYGAHLFHTNDEIVWKYVNLFSDWVRWEHKVIASVAGKFVSVPVNISTVNEICATHLKTIEDMDTWLAKNQVDFERIENSEQMALSKVGKVLYETLFKNYSMKQWNKDPSELGPEVLARIPVRHDFDSRYFDDKYQALPKNGYTSFVSNMIASDNITICLNTDYFDVRDKFIETPNVLVYTGPIDRYFKGVETLEYRSLNFHTEVYRNMNYYQPNSVVNYPEEDVPFTRIIEYKHFLNQKSKDTVIVKETSSAEGEPYYPVLNEKNKRIFDEFKKMADEEKGVVFAGRLANYKYYNMDQAIANALWLFENVIKCE